MNSKQSQKLLKVEINLIQIKVIIENNRINKNKKSIKII